MIRYWKWVGAVLAVAILAAVLVAGVPAAKGGQGGPQLIEVIHFNK